MHLFRSAALVAAILLTLRGSAAEVALIPVADTSLIEIFPTNNLGGARFILIGTGENLTKHRALLRFDLAGQVPPGSRITSASLWIEVVGQPANGFSSSAFQLHRVLQDWGEGNKTSPTNCTSCLGQGAPASVNEATWRDRFAFAAAPWTEPGGRFTNDFDPLVSSEVFIYQADLLYEFPSTERLVADVQSWLDQPASNFGWMMKTSVEETAFTARRVGSREDTSNAPRLVLQYVPPPRIEGVIVTNQLLSFRFEAEAGQPYEVQRRESINGGSWATVTNVPAPVENSMVTISDSLGAASRFYRVLAP